MDVQEIETAALQLDLKSRGRLAEKLLHSLEELSQKEVSQLWAEEAQGRDAAMDSDPTRGLPAEDVFREAHSLIQTAPSSR